MSLDNKIEARSSNPQFAGLRILSPLSAMATADTGVVETLERQPPERLHEVAQRIVDVKTLTIYTYGYTGAGKSSLVRDLLGPKATKAPKACSGPNANPSAEVLTDFSIDIGNGLSIPVFDTRGMFERGRPNQDKEILRVVGNVCRFNDNNGVLVICIPMNVRLTREGEELLVLLHKEYHEKGIWNFVVIALTKADIYNEDEWLVDKKLTDSPVRHLKQHFQDTLSDFKEALKEVFTGPIGISEKEFNSIPIVPTSQLTNRSAMKKMAAVQYECWFDALLLACCKKERGTHLVKVHAQRLNRLTPEQLTAAGYPARENIGVEILPFLRYSMGQDFGYHAVIGAWKLYWHLVYYDKLKKGHRFLRDKEPQ